MGQTKILPVPCVPQSTNQRRGGMVLWSRGWVCVCVCGGAGFCLIWVHWSWGVGRLGLGVQSFYKRFILSGQGGCPQYELLTGGPEISMFC